MTIIKNRTTVTVEHLGNMVGIGVFDALTDTVRLRRPYQ
jgi:hypothetical protein